MHAAIIFAVCFLFQISILNHTVQAQEITPDAQSTSVNNNDFMTMVERPDEDLLIFEFKIGDILLQEAILTYEDLDTSTYYLPLSDVMNALEIPILVNNDQGTAQGWFITEANTFDLSLRNGKAIIRGQDKPLKKGSVERHGDGIYASIEALETWLPITIDVDFANLAIVVSSLQTLPIENKFARDRERDGLDTSGPGAVRPQNPLIRPDEPRFTLPFVDTSVQSRYNNAQGQNKNFGVQYSATARSIVFGQDARYTLNDQTDDQESPDVRLTVGRRAYENESLIGGLSEYALGDISTVQIPMIARNNAGRGVYLTNMPEYRNFLNGSDTITLRGELAVGYQIDVKRNGELLDFIEGPDENGEYIFDELAVFPGLNVFELVFYGPQGQDRTEEERVFITDNPAEQGKIGFRVNAIQDNTNLFTKRNDEDEDSEKLRAIAEVNYGLNRLTALHAGAATYSMEGEQKAYGLFGVQTSLNGLRLDLSQALSAEGTGTSARVESIFKGFRWQFQHQYYRDFISEDNILSGLAGDLKHESDLRISGIFPFMFLKNMPLTLQAERLQNVEGEEQYDWSLRATKNINRIRATGTLQQVIPPSSDRRTDLNLQVSSRINDFTLRGTARYSIEPEAALEAISLTSDLRIDEKTKARFGVSRSGSDNPIHGVSLGLNRDFGVAQVGFNTTYNDDGNFTAFLGASFGFAYDPVRKQPYFSSRNLSDSSALFASVYQDDNVDGEWQDPEEYLEGVEFALKGNKKLYATDENGGTFIPELRSFERASVDIINSSFPDPFMRTDPPYIDYLMRPSQIHTRAYPLVLMGEVDGNISIFSPKSKRPASSIQIDILKPDQSIVVSAKSEFDGFYLIQDVPVGAYEIAPNAEQIEKLGYCPVIPQEISMTADDPFASVKEDFVLYPRPDLIEENRWLVVAQDMGLEAAQTYVRDAEERKAAQGKFKGNALDLKEIAENSEEQIEGNLENDAGGANKLDDQGVTDTPETKTSTETKATSEPKTKFIKKEQPYYIFLSNAKAERYSVINGPYDDLTARQRCEIANENSDMICHTIREITCEEYRRFGPATGQSALSDTEIEEKYGVSDRAVITEEAVLQKTKEPSKMEKLFKEKIIKRK